MWKHLEGQVRSVIARSNAFYSCSFGQVCTVILTMSHTPEVFTHSMCWWCYSLLKDWPSFGLRLNLDVTKLKSSSSNKLSVKIATTSPWPRKEKESLTGKRIWRRGAPEEAEEASVATCPWLAQPLAVTMTLPRKFLTASALMLTWKASLSIHIPYSQLKRTEESSKNPSGTLRSRNMLGLCL